MTRDRRPAPAAQPPGAVRLTDGPGYRAAARSRHPLIGLAARSRPVYYTPGDGHLLATAPPGAGATALVRLSGHAHPWARSLEHVTYLDEPDRIHRHLTGLAHQARRRTQAHAP